MNRRFFLTRCVIALSATLTMSATTVQAVRLPVSTVTVKVLSVERESFKREESKYPLPGGSTYEYSSYVAKAQIIDVPHNEHHLSAGSIIDVRYDVTVRQPALPPSSMHPTLSPGATTTLSLFGSGSSFRWR